MSSATSAIALGVRLTAFGGRVGSGTATLKAGAQASGLPRANSDNISGSRPAGLKSYLPSQTVPFGFVEVMEGGKMTRKPVLVDAATWYKFLTYFVDVYLGGLSGPTLQSVADDVIATKQAASAATEQAQAVTQQVNANAEALKATVEVVQSNSLSGAAQIPTPVLREQAF